MPPFHRTGPPNRVEMLQMVANGYTQVQIARQFDMHPLAVYRALEQVRKRWDLPDLAAVVAAALEAKLIR